MIENIHKFIRNKYGQDSLKQVRIYERTARKVADFRNHSFEVSEGGLYAEEYQIIFKCDRSQGG